MTFLHDIAPILAASAVAVATVGVACDLGDRIGSFDGARRGVWQLVGVLVTVAGFVAAAEISLAALPLTATLAVLGALAATVALAGLDTRLQLQRLHIARAQARADRVQRLATYDRATGLPNRLLFAETLMKRLARVRLVDRAPKPLGLVYAELRGQRSFVEQLGRERFDRVLRKLAGRLSRQLRSGEMLARLSPEGLVLLVEERDGRTTAQALSALCAELSTPVADGDEVIRFAWNVGSSRFPEHGDTMQELIRTAMGIQQQVGNAAAACAVIPFPVYARAS